MNAAKRTLCLLAALSVFGVSAAHAQGADRYYVTELGSLGASAPAAVMGTNSQGQFVGMASIADGTFHGFVLIDGVMKDLGPLGGPAVSEADAINSAGVIVGATRVSLWGVQRAAG